ncbi:MAG TPA: hypothetical protein VE309_14890 [Caulobacteraceae bacterium]|nr:hypothetical protein [Caulobacteraceae bacterium]
MSAEILPSLAAVLPLAIWIYLIAAHGGFWLARQRDDRGQPPDPAA